MQFCIDNNFTTELHSSFWYDESQQIWSINVYGIFDIAVGSDSRTNLTDVIELGDAYPPSLIKPLVQKIHSDAKEFAYGIYSSISWSLEESIGTNEKNERTEYIREIKQGALTANYNLFNVQNGTFLWMLKEINELKGGDRIPDPPRGEVIRKISEFVKTNKKDTEINSFLTSMKMLESDECEFEEFSRVIATTTRFSDVVIWKHNLETHRLVTIGSTLDINLTCNLRDGAIGRAVRNKRAIVVPSLISREGAAFEFQHPRTVKGNDWKSMVAAPLFVSENLVGGIGLYGKDFLYLKRAETLALLYLFSSLSKNLFRQIVRDGDESKSLSKKMMDLAPMVYTGLKASDRLHSLKNSSQAFTRKSERLKDKLSFLQTQFRKKPKDDEKVALIEVELELLKQDTIDVHRRSKIVSEQISDFLKISGGKYAETTKRLSVVKIQDRIEDVLNEWTAGSDVEREFVKLDDSTGEVLCDLVEVEQAVRNIIDNAIYFLNLRTAVKKPRLVCKLELAERRFVIDITDNAGGFNQSEIDEVTIAYFSGREKKGTGLGLWMSKRILEDHDGTLTIGNTEAGARVCMEIPLLQ